jgi:hypothetical protein
VHFQRREAPHEGLRRRHKEHRAGRFARRGDDRVAQASQRSRPPGNRQNRPQASAKSPRRATVVNMKRPGYNPIRRNRNIGTENAGYGQNNRLVIPEKWTESRRYYEKLKNPVFVPITVWSAPLHVVVEPPLPGFVHACTVEDIIHLLEFIPAAHFSDIRMIVLRQPKRKERILSLVWGRWQYFSEIGNLSGSAIYLEAQDIRSPKKWPNSMNPEDALEMERLQGDGHEITLEKRFYSFVSTLDSVRNTQLFRTLPHEIGHYVHLQQFLELPNGDERYRNIPSQEKETFAHRYADEFRARMKETYRIPFDRIVSEHNLKQQGLKPEWFSESTCQ